MLRPRFIPKSAPCAVGCPIGVPVRDWLQAIVRRGPVENGWDDALAAAWEIVAEANPFPALLGRICPHPCESGCVRSEKDTSVSIRACERYLGDWAIRRGLRLPVLEPRNNGVSVGVVGAGPSGLSFAYQMIRRGYPVTVYEKSAAAGGAAYWQIPRFRQPDDVLAAEIQRIVDWGVKIVYRCEVGADVALDVLKRRHRALFIGIGAGVGRRLDIPGERGDGVWSGIDYLSAVKRGDFVSPGTRVAVVGGGDTAVDAARTAIRQGASVTLFYRRSRSEMPAIPEEIAAAEREGVDIVCRAVPVRIVREAARVSGVEICSTVSVGGGSEETRRVAPLPGTESVVPVDGVIVAISQTPAGALFDALPTEDGRLSTDADGEAAPGIWVGGDGTGVGRLVTAVGDGAAAARRADRMLRGERETPRDIPLPPISSIRVRPEAAVCLASSRRDRGRNAAQSSSAGVSTDEGDAFLEAVSRCLGCGACIGCERCWTVCTPGALQRISTAPGDARFGPMATRCDGCGKCAAACPTGFIDMTQPDDDEDVSHD